MSAKIRPVDIDRKKISWLLEQDLDVKLEALQHHVSITWMLINEILDNEVTQLAGENYSHHKPHDGRYSRWGYNKGSVKLGDRKLRVKVPRIYDNQEQSNKSLETYQKLRDLKGVDERLLYAVLLGLSTRDYDQVVGNIVNSFGLSSSSVSREFIQQSAEKLKRIEERDLSGYSFVSIFIDGKYFAGEQMLIALGVTSDGRKIPLGFAQSANENNVVIKELLQNLIDRGLHYDQGLLFVVDGSKGIHKAIRELLGSCGVIQRCQWHKRENVLKYLKEDIQDSYRRRINKAYGMDTYQDAKIELKTIIRDLRVENISSARSLEEGLEETLTLHRLGLNERFSRSFNTTNCIENLNSMVGRYLKKVKNWQNSEQRYRWMAVALLEAETRMRRVHNYKQLHLLKKAIKEEVLAKQQKENLNRVA